MTYLVVVYLPLMLQQSELNYLLKLKKKFLIQCNCYFVFLNVLDC